MVNWANIGNIISGIDENQFVPDTDDHLPVVRPKAKVQLNLNDSVYSMNNSYKEATPPLGNFLTC